MSTLASVVAKCRGCKSRLDPSGSDDITMGVCSSCKVHPELRHILATSPVRGSNVGSRQTTAREITPAEKALIRKVHGYMPAEQLLGILNERMASDLGVDYIPYTMEQLYAEIGDAAGTVPSGGHDWPSLRKLLARARRSGVLTSVTEQVIDDFAVVYSLNMRQVLTLKDIVLRANNEEDQS